MEVASPGQGANGYPLQPEPKPAIDEDTIVRYLVDLVELTLGATEEDLYARGNLLSDGKRSETIQRCVRFASETQVALYVQKNLSGSDVPKGLLNGHNDHGM